MQDCIDDDKKLLVEKQTEVNRLKKVPNWESKPTIKTEVEKLEKEIETEKKKLKEQEDKLAALPEECIQPVTLEITFERMNNTISGKDDNQLKKIAQFLKDNPSVKIQLIGNTAMTKGASQNAIPPEKVIETIETSHTMPDDSLPKSLSADEIKEIRNRKTTTKDLMMIRAERVKQLFLTLKVPSDQIQTKAGKNLGAPSDNQKVILEFF